MNTLRVYVDATREEKKRLFAGSRFYLTSLETQESKTGSLHTQKNPVHLLIGTHKHHFFKYNRFQSAVAELHSFALLLLRDNTCIERKKKKNLYWLAVCVCV